MLMSANGDYSKVLPILAVNTSINTFIIPQTVRFSF